MNQTTIVRKHIYFSPVHGLYYAYSKDARDGDTELAAISIRDGYQTIALKIDNERFKATISSNVGYGRLAYIRVKASYMDKMLLNFDKNKLHERAKYELQYYYGDRSLTVDAFQDILDQTNQLYNSRNGELRPREIKEYMQELILLSTSSHWTVKNKYYTKKEVNLTNFGLFLHFNNVMGNFVSCIEQSNFPLNEYIEDIQSLCVNYLQKFKLNFDETHQQALLKALNQVYQFMLNQDLLPLFVNQLPTSLEE